MFSDQTFVDASFIEFLAARLGLKADERPQSNEWSRVGNTIGALALRLGLLDESQIDKVLETQDAHGGYFGELAVKAGYLTSIQVAQLLEMQSLHEQLYLAEQLVIIRRLDVPALITHLSEYLNDHLACGTETAAAPQIA